MKAPFTVILGLLFALAGQALAEAPETIFDTANRLYGEGKFSEATAAYEKILESGHGSAAVYFDLGNAFFKANRIGRAIAAYREAKMLSPRDPDIVANLQFARNQVQGPTLPTTWQDRWFGKLSLNEWTLAVCAAGWSWLLLLTLGQWRPALKPTLRGWAWSLGAVTLLTGACLGADYSRLVVERKAVVIADSAEVHQAPVAESPGLYTLHDGAEVRVLDAKNDWLQITTGPRRTGWVRRAELVLSR